MRRQVKMIGKSAQDADIDIVWHGVRVFSGRINDQHQPGCLASWVTDTAQWGNIDMEITVRHGLITWIDIHMNYTGIYLPLPGSESSGAVRIRPRDFYGPPHRLLDGKLDVSIDSESVIIQRTEDTQGPWHYDVSAGQILRARYRVDRRCLVLHDPMS
jgi:hypothetical protein